MNSKEQYYRDHPCPSWAEEKQWAKLLEKIIFPPEGGINYSELSVNEVKVLEGYSFGSILSQRFIHKDEREALIKLQKLEVFANGRKKDALGEEARVLIKFMQENPDLKNNEIARKVVDIAPNLFKEMKPESLAEKISRLRNK